MDICEKKPIEEAPNNNIMLIGHIEGLLSEVTANLELIQANYPKEQRAKETAMKGIIDYEKSELHILRTLCEGD